MEKVSYRLLKKLYRAESMTAEAVNAFTESKEEKKPNKYTTYLSMDKLIESYVTGQESDGAGGFSDGVTHWRITLRGRDYIEQRRKDLFMFWIPYAITTVLAIAALIG